MNFFRFRPTSCSTEVRRFPPSARSMPLSLTQLNATDCSRFTAILGHLFEHSPWVAEETWPQRPFRDREQLHAALCATLHRSPRARRLALIRAHPDLAGRLARERRLTAASDQEQASAGLHALTDAELATFTRENAAYRAKFDFPFIICARLNDKTAIVQAMRARLTHPAEQEFATALAEIEKIAWLRLLDSVAP